MRAQFIEKQKKAWPVTLMCRGLNVSRSGYYDWLARGWRRHTRANHGLDKRMREIFVGPANVMVRHELPRGYAMRAFRAVRSALS